MNPDQLAGAGLVIGLVCGIAGLVRLLTEITPRPEREAQR